MRATNAGVRFVTHDRGNFQVACAVDRHADSRLGDCSVVSDD